MVEGLKKEMCALRLRIEVDEMMDRMDAVPIEMMKRWTEVRRDIAAMGTRIDDLTRGICLDAPEEGELRGLRERLVDSEEVPKGIVEAMEGWEKEARVLRIRIQRLEERLQSATDDADKARRRGKRTTLTLHRNNLCECKECKMH